MIRVVAALAMAAPAWPPCRGVCSRALWRSSPHLGIKLLVALAAGCAAIVAVAVLVPVPVLVAGAAAAIGLAAVEAWLARDRRGRGAGLPPGSLGLLPLGPWREQGFYSAQARRHGPLFKTRQIVRPMACIADLPTGRRLLRDADDDLVAPPLPFSRFIPGGYLRYRDPAEHARYKDTFRLAFSRDVMAAHEPALRHGFRSGLAAAASEGAAGVPPRARVNRLLFPLWAGLFAGLDPAAPAVVRLKELAHVIDTRNPTWASDRRVRGAAAELTGILQAQRTLFASLPPEQVPRCFLDEIRRRQPDALDDPAVLGNLVFLFHVTWSDVSGLLTWIVHMLADDPAVVARVRTEAGRGEEGGRIRDSLASRIVLETLRLEQSEHIYRRTTSAVHVGDANIPAGWIVRVGVHEAHRDPSVFERPDAFDPDRFLGRSYTKDEYSPFGAHRLACLGEHVTLTVARTFTEELATASTSAAFATGPPSSARGATGCRAGAGASCSRPSCRRNLGERAAARRPEGDGGADHLQRGGTDRAGPRDRSPPDVPVARGRRRRRRLT
jgi:cytochrome P450